MFFISYLQNSFLKKFKQKKTKNLWKSKIYLEIYLEKKLQIAFFNKNYK